MLNFVSLFQMKCKKTNSQKIDQILKIDPMRRTRGHKMVLASWFKKHPG